MSSSVTSDGSTPVSARTWATVVTLELTETTFLGNAPRALDALVDIRAIGVKLALDDFGTGYSCLAYLRRFPFSVVKIDRAFVADSDPSVRAIVGAIIALAHQLGLTVVAEGIETAQQLEQMIGMGADHVQGYFLSPPLLFDRLTEHLLQPMNATVIRLPVGDAAAMTNPS